MSTFFDVGGIVGGIGAGLWSDFTGQRASTCGIMLIIGAGMVVLCRYQCVDLHFTI